jgi:hypothetical protein
MELEAGGMFKDDVLARIHLGAILMLLEDIAAFDQSARDLTKDWNLAIQFQLPGSDPATVLIFDHGDLKALNQNHTGLKSHPYLPRCPVPERRFPGTFAEAAPARHQCRFPSQELKNLDKLLALLEHYMKPDETLLKDPKVREFCIRLNLYALLRHQTDR